MRGKLDNDKGNRMRPSPCISLVALTVAAALAALSLVASGSALAFDQHQSFLRIPANAPGTPQQIKLGLNKATIIELPRPVRNVMVSNPGQIDAVMQSSTRAYVIGKQLGEANIMFTDKDGNQVAMLEITIERDFSGLKELLDRLLPNSHIQVQGIGERVVLTGTVTSPIDATRACEVVTSFLGALDQQTGSSASGGGSAITVNSNSGSNSGSGNGGSALGNACETTNVINMLTVEGREQVLLKVSVVEMERNIVKQFGVDLNALVDSGNFAFAALSDLPFPINVAGKGVLAPFLTSTEPNISGNNAAFPTTLPANPTVANTSGFGTQWQSSGSRVQSVLRMLEEDGLLHTLAEPNLTAISGETANFLAGGEFPVPVAQQLGTISVEFKKFGIGLAFTPVVMSEGRISLKVSTEVSELSNQGAVILSNISIPALKVRRAETVVELPSGGSLVMAGLLSDQSKQALSGYPGLKNLPVLGTLFRSRDFLKNQTELVVLVTPYIVKPVARSKLGQPDDGFGWASDVNSDLLGQMNRVYGRHPERAPVGKFDGDVGFIVE
ncbi:type II and III secretion system protein family protein [Methyloceanibacter sp.]|uniref:type II and III secretion system protein family protein n=1 Tax=Methyloceanibacter sp. TaxID=1965321 RepID=UPI002D4677B8|nr:type II and III secretion system protein family protein [Methyloceanibacter sp.]HZP09501.1 type II and III secretion system protein family protein [Methyloceanibacter sp.]